MEEEEDKLEKVKSTPRERMVLLDLGVQQLSGSKGLGRLYK